jgi:hypothetical protein
MNIKEDLEDIGPRFDGAPDLEFRAATKALELEKSALSYQRVPPGYRFPYGHTHMKQEEVYVVLRGSGRMKVDDKIVQLKEWDAMRVPPGMWARRRIVSSISSPRPGAKSRLAPMRRNPAFSSTRSKPMLSEAARAYSGRSAVSTRRICSAALAMPFPHCVRSTQ